MNKLKYEPLNDSHSNSLLPIWADEDVIRYTNIKSPYTLEEVRERIKRLKEFDVFVVSNEDKVIGIIGCPCINQEKLGYGLFYQFSKSSWGQGYATKSMTWLMDFMKEKYQEVTLFADVVVDNVASEKILMKFNFDLISEEELESNGRKFKVHNYKL